MKNKLFTNAITGSIIGDVLGSTYEFAKTLDYNFKIFTEKATFTDDTIHTMGIASGLLSEVPDFKSQIIKLMNEYPGRNYGPRTLDWSKSKIASDSFGNGSAMRVSAIACYFNDIESIQYWTNEATLISHTHPEALKGAQSIAECIFLARNGLDKEEIRNYISNKYHYNLNFTIKEIRGIYSFNPTCQGSVPQAIVAFIDSNDYESCIRNAISIGGDADTLACMSGGIAAAYYKFIPNTILNFVFNKLPSEFIKIINEDSFNE